MDGNQFDLVDRNEQENILPSALSNGTFYSFRKWLKIDIVRAVATLGLDAHESCYWLLQPRVGNLKTQSSKLKTESETKKVCQRPFLFLRMILVTGFYNIESKT